MGVRRARSRHRAFTLIELLVVLVIIAILLAVAVPLLIRSKVAANEASALGSLRSITSCEELFRTENKYYGTLAELNGEQLVDPELGKGKKAEYIFDCFVEDETRGSVWYAEGHPEVHNRTGLNTFYVDESGVIRYRDTGGAVFVPRADAEGWSASE